MTADPIDIIFLYHYQNDFCFIYLLSGTFREQQMMDNYC